jgi:hypothetical protein
MRAVVHDRYGLPDVLRLDEVGRADARWRPDVESGPGEDPLSPLAPSADSRWEEKSRVNRWDKMTRSLPWADRASFAAKLA